MTRFTLFMGRLLDRHFGSQCTIFFRLCITYVCMYSTQNFDQTYMVIKYIDIVHLPMLYIIKMSGKFAKTYTEKVFHVFFLFSFYNLRRFSFIWFFSWTSICIIFCTNIYLWRLLLLKWKTRNNVKYNKIKNRRKKIS